MNPQINRWRQAIVGVILLLLAGMVYAWSVLSIPIAQEFASWTKAQLSMTFTLTMILFCVGCLVGGLLNRRLTPRIFVLISAVLFLVGFFAASCIKTAMGLYLSFGVLCGLASGFVYNAVMGTVSAWFPDRQGLISGVLLMGFGLSSFLVGKLYQAFTPAQIGGWRISFRVMGVITLVVFVICSFFLKRPGSDFVPPASAAARKKWSNPVAEEAPAQVMMRRPAFWMYYLWAVLLSAAGLALVSQASGIARQVGPQVEAGVIATVVGLISIFNGIGRVIAGSLFDRLGRSMTMQLTNVTFLIAGAILLAALSCGSFPVLVLGFIVGGLAYGGITPTNSAFISSYYGRKHYSVNFSIINTNLIVASFGSTIAGSLYDASMSYMSTIAMIVVLGALGIAASIGISLCDKAMLSGRSAR